MPEDLLGVSEAQNRLLAHFNALNTECIPLGKSLGRVLAQEIVSFTDLPAFSNSAMDGFAVRHQDISNAGSAHPVNLKVIADISAGSEAELQIQPGTAARIMTGAPIPAGADCVVPIEDTDAQPGKPGEKAPHIVTIYQAHPPGKFIRHAGQDIHAGETVFQAGKRLRAIDLGFLAMLGLDQVQVYAKPRIAVFSSGDELVSTGTPLSPGKVYDSNSYVLSGLIEQLGGEAHLLGIAPDRFEQVKELLDEAVQQDVDLIVSSAGVSVGAFDFVRSVVETNGELSFWRVNMRPGKPIAFGHYQSIPFIGLPGNPVSAFVGFEVFIRPAILKMAGMSHLRRTVRRVILQEAVESDGRESYLRAIVTEQEQGRLVARLSGHQGSGNLRALVQANALLVIPSSILHVPAGSVLDAWMLED